MIKGIGILLLILVIWSLKAEHTTRVAVTVAVIFFLGFVVANRGKK